MLTVAWPVFDQDPSRFRGSPVIRSIALGLVAALAIAGAASAQTDPSQATTPTYSCATTDIGDLLDNPATKAVLVKWIPQVVGSPDIKKGRVYTLVAIAPYVPELTPDMLAKIDTDLAKAPRS